MKKPFYWKTRLTWVLIVVRWVKEGEERRETAGAPGQHFIHRPDLNISLVQVTSTFVILDTFYFCLSWPHGGISSVAAWVSPPQFCLRRCSSSFFSPCSITLTRAARGGKWVLTCLIAFDSSLSSPVDQWSSVLFIRNINAPHIPAASATVQWAQPDSEALFSICS